MFEGTINIFDIIAAIFLIALIIIFSNIYKNTKLQNNPEYKYYTWGLITKIIGAIALAFIYVFYYGGGDTMYYFWGGETLANTFFTEPKIFFELLFLDSDNLTIDLQKITNQIIFSHSPEEWIMVKITSFFNLLSFNRYLITSILMSLVAFYGSWKMFKAFLFFFPKYDKAIFISIYLLPSVIFWSSGILKDTITFAALGIFFYHFVKIFFKYKISIASIVVLLLSTSIIFILKAYIILGFIPALFIGLYINFQNKITNKIVKLLLAPILFATMLLIGYSLIVNLLTQSKKYEISSMESRVEGFHTWHTTQGGSSYNLGKVDYTVIGVLSKVPESLNVTFFRPYLWEARNITSLMGAIESSVVMMLFLILLWQNRLRWIKLSFKNSFLSLAITYSIIFGFAVGFTSYNFGALARYKVPVMPFFMFLLLYFYYKNKFSSPKQT